MPMSAEHILETVAGEGVAADGVPDSIKVNHLILLCSLNKYTVIEIKYSCIC
jgi:hypothetical protein